VIRIDKRLAFISDLHGNIEALNSVLKDIQAKAIDRKDVYCLGDLVGYGTRPNEVIELLKSHHIQTILGNYDEAVAFYLPTCGCSINSESDRVKTKNSLQWAVDHISDENKVFLRSFEENLSLTEAGYRIYLTHASPLSITDYVYEDDLDKQEQIADDLDEDIIIFGHTHYPYVKRVRDKIFINPGSVGRPKDGDNRACYCILKLGMEIEVEFVRVPYDIEKMAKEIEESELLDVFAQVLRTGRDTK
jgi:putative phosphoesterase